VPSSPAVYTVNIHVRRRSSSTALAIHLFEISCDLKPAGILDRANAHVSRLIVTEGLPEAVRNAVYLLKHINRVLTSMRMGVVSFRSEAKTWCHTLVRDTSFQFPFEARLVLFQSIAWAWLAF
jgi:hypothetical protein